MNYSLQEDHAEIRQLQCLLVIPPCDGVDTMKISNLLKKKMFSAGNSSVFAILIFLANGTNTSSKEG